jgi:hypothetical protein
MQIPAFLLFQEGYRRLRRELLPRASRAAVRHDHEPLIPTMLDKSQFQRGAT